MKTIYDIYEGVLDIDGTLEQGDSFNDLYNDAVEKIPTIDDFVRVKRGQYSYLLTWDCESLFDMYRDHYPKALHPRIKGMGIAIKSFKGDIYVCWYMLDILKGKNNKDFTKLINEPNRIHQVGTWGYLDNIISSKKAMKLVIKQIESFVKNPTEITNWLDRLEQQLPYPTTSASTYSIVRTFPESLI
jgi:hypothetical protein